MSDTKTEAQTFDLNDPRLANPEEFDSYDINPDGDAFAPPPPVPDGSYDVTVAIQNGKIIRNVVKSGPNKGKPFLAADLELTVVDPGGEFDGRKIFSSVTSLVRQASNTSAVAGLLKALGVEVPSRTNDGALFLELASVVATEPTVRVRTKWRASAKDADGNYQTIKNGMRSFPALDDEGTKFNHLVTDPLTGEQVSARAEVLRYDIAE